MKTIFTRNILFLSMLMILTTSALVHAKDPFQGIAADIDKGMQDLDIPLLEKAVKQCEEMAKKDSKDYRISYYGAKAHFAIADCLDIKSGEEFDLSGNSDEHLDQALDLIKVAQGLNENTVDIPVLAFTILRRKMLHVSFPGLMAYIGDRTLAYDKAKALAPDNVDVLMICALQLAEGMFPPPPPEEPIAEFKKILEKDPKLAEVYYQIGGVWDKAKKTGDARINYQKALELNPNHHWAKKKLQVLASGAGS
jgi:tetratricopeptide (TPR) repeat protein